MLWQGGKWILRLILEVSSYYEKAVLDEGNVRSLIADNGVAFDV